MKAKPHIAIVGATGAVGLEMIKTLEKRKFPVGQLTLLASARSAGKELPFRGQPVTVRELTADSFQGIDIALFSAGASISREFAPKAVQAGCVVIDNSSAFRMDEAVPLVVPEINAEDIALHKGIIANPNCTTAITLMALYPLHQAFGVKRIFASSYQAVSGTGAKAIEELRRQVAAGRGGRAGDQGGVSAPDRLQRPAAGGCVFAQRLHQGRGQNGERRPQDHAPSRFRASVTCVRVPVYRAHSVAVSAEFEKPVTVEAARAVLAKAPGLDVVDNPAKQEYPLPLYASDKYNCQVGRLRLDCAFDNGLCFWVAGDQLLKGAALNAVQIAEELLKL
jgi:aspartate-semialdehyde dehydrogenase